MKKILVTFATPKWYDSQELLIQSSKNNGFSGYIKYTEKSKDWEFVKKYRNIYTDTRGYGYWQWKTKIILDAMSQIDYGDCVGYIDSGNIIINNLDYVFNLCETQNIVLFDNRDGNYEGVPHKNGVWTKRDCFVLMNCDNEYYYNAPQTDASYQFYKKTDDVLKFLDEYDTYCSNENIISDLPNITESKLPHFKVL